MRRTTQIKETEIVLQMAPMINVMLVLLAAFVATAGVIQSENWLRVPNRQTGSSDIFVQPVTIKIDAKGQLYFNQASLAGDSDQQILALQQRLDRLINLLPNQAVIIKPHADTVHERVVQVVNACKFAQVKKLSLGENR